MREFERSDSGSFVTSSGSALGWLADMMAGKVSRRQPSRRRIAGSMKVTPFSLLDISRNLKNSTRMASSGATIRH